MAKQIHIHDDQIKRRLMRRARARIRLRHYLQDKAFDSYRRHDFKELSMFTQAALKY